jgi:hypothetical protein
MAEMADITIDEAFINEVRGRLSTISGQISAVRAGTNPNDLSHPHGLPFSNLQVLAGGGNFQNGVSVKSKVGAIGGQVDGKLTQLDKKIGGYVQGLGNILLSTDTLEQANQSAADFTSFLNGTPAPPAPPTY